MKAVIMAGGRGTRLKPLTNSIPKPLVPILDKPVLYYILRLLYKYNITQVGMTLGYMPEKIKQAFGDGHSFGMNITYFTEEEPLGTAGGVKNAEEFLDDDFLVISGDAFTDINLSELIDFHYLSGGIATIAAKRVKDPSLYGVMLTDSDGRITAFEEKPLHPVSNLVNTGIYVMNKELLRLIPQGFCDFSKHVFPLLLGRLYAKECDCYWSDIGTLQSYYAANYYVADNIRRFERV